MCIPKKSTPESIQLWLDKATEYNNNPRNSGSKLYRWRIFDKFIDLYFDKSLNMMLNIWVEETPVFHGIELRGLKKLPEVKRFTIF